VALMVSIGYVAVLVLTREVGASDLTVARALVSRRRAR
jgi:hypothetical protein